MKVKIEASSKLGYELPVEEAMRFSGIEAGICYMPDKFETLVNEPKEKSLKRAQMTLKSKHHSVFGHATYNLVLEDVPKIVAMLLNNEHIYNTSEKSARYTKMATNGLEAQYYEKWGEIFRGLIRNEYPELNEKTVNKLALENARYFISVFSPATTMGYTVSLQQINYIIGWARGIAEEPFCGNKFMEYLQPCMKELADLLTEKVGVEGLVDCKGRSFSLFAQKHREEEWGENYSVNYTGSFAQLAQAQRHRTLWYEMKIPWTKNTRFYVPRILRTNGRLRNEYLKDMRWIVFPQATLVNINERGTIEAFAMKCQERLCGSAQLEIALQTRRTLERYCENVCSKIDCSTYAELFEMMMQNTRCRFAPGFECKNPCPLGPEEALTRLV